jgi:hypothetical protein
MLLSGAVDEGSPAPKAPPPPVARAAAVAVVPAASDGGGGDDVDVPEHFLCAITCVRSGCASLALLLWRATNAPFSFRPYICLSLPLSLSRARALGVAILPLISSLIFCGCLLLLLFLYRAFNILI